MSKKKDDKKPRPVNYADLLRDWEQLPPTCVAEVVAGELYASPRPAGPHTLSAASLLAQLATRLMLERPRPGGWWIVGEPELHFDWDILVPDLAGWRRERLPDYPRGPFVEEAPDWVCEVLSPRTARLDLEEKLPVYGRAGCSHAWVIAPEAQRLEVFRWTEDRWRRIALHRNDEVVCCEPFPEVTLRLGTLWEPVGVSRYG